MFGTIKLGLISEGTNTWPLYVAQARRFFEAEQIAVEVTVTGSSVEQQAGLIEGRFDVGFQQADHVVRAVEQGHDLFIFMAHGHAPDLSLVAAPGTRNIGDLRGRTIGVDGARTGYALLLRRLLRQQGLADSEAPFREFGGSRERYNAMKSGEAAASLLNAPFDASLLAEGYAVLARMAERFPTYPGSVMAARRSWARANETVLLAFVRGYDGAYRWLSDASNQAAALELMPRHLDIAPPAALAALQEFARTPRPELTADGLQQVIDTVWESEHYTGPKQNAARYMDLSYMNRALDE